MRRRPRRLGARPRTRAPCRPRAGRPADRDRSLRWQTISRVSACHPQSRWLPLRPTSTVSTGLSSSTPWRAQASSAPSRRRDEARLRLGEQLEDARERARPALGRRKRQPVGVAERRIRILADDDDLHAGRSDQAQRAQRIVRSDRPIARGGARPPPGRRRRRSRRPARQHGGPRRRQRRQRRAEIARLHASRPASATPGIVGAHERLADEERVDAGRAHAAHVGRARGCRSR